MGQRKPYCLIILEGEMNLEMSMLNIRERPLCSYHFRSEENGHRKSRKLA